MSHWIATHPSPVAAATALCVLWLAESLAPFFAHERARMAHGVRNVALGLVNALVRASFFPAALLFVAAWSDQHRWGVVPRLSAWVAPLASILLLDFVNYAFHIASHHWRWLWRFHAVHHHDEAVDSTTALRFHAGDVLFNSLVILATVALFGIPIEHLFLYEAILLPLSIFHHGNIRIPERRDRALRTVIVTPRMHWVHHSRWHAETDSNYSGIFSFWDRLFATFRLRQDPATLELGLDGYDPADHATLRGCLTTPFAPIKSLPGHAPASLQEGPDAGGQSRPLASPSTHPSRGRHLPLALAVASNTPPLPRTLRPCTIPDPPRPITAPVPG